MIHNYFTYLYISASAFGASLSIVFRTLHKKRQGYNLWNTTSVYFILYLLISCIFLVIAFLFIEESGRLGFLQNLLFYLVVAVSSSLTFYFLRIFALPLNVIIILGLFVFFRSTFSEYHSVDDESHFTIRVIKVEENSVKVEQCNFNGSITFEELSEEHKGAIFHLVKIPKYLFWSESPVYIKFTGYFFANGNDGSREDKTAFTETAVLPFCKGEIVKSEFGFARRVFSESNLSVDQSGAVKTNNSE